MSTSIQAQPRLLSRACPRDGHYDADVDSVQRLVLPTDGEHRRRISQSPSADPVSRSGGPPIGSGFVRGGSLIGSAVLQTISSKHGHSYVKPKLTYRISPKETNFQLLLVQPTRCCIASPCSQEP